MFDFGWYKENLYLLIIDTKKQLEDAVAFIDGDEDISREELSSNDSSIDNQKSMLESRCYKDIARLRTNKKMEKDYFNALKGIRSIASNLEKIADYTLNVVNQTQYLSDPDYFKKNYDYKYQLGEVIKGIDLIYDALFEKNIDTSLDICNLELDLDKYYVGQFSNIIDNLNINKTASENLVTSLFILHYIERMGDSLLNIGEAIISVILGDTFKIDQFEFLEKALNDNVESKLSLKDVRFQSIWGTRSGCRIGTLYSEDKKFESIYKNGALKKLQKEQKGINKWAANFPKIPPKILSFKKSDSQGSILMEKIYGNTIKELILNKNEELLIEALEKLKEQLAVIWKQTKVEKQSKAAFVEQIESRLDDIYYLHKDFKSSSHTELKLGSDSFKNILKKLKKKESKISCPFKVLLHGDFNLDNIIYNPEKKTIHFIDLHRAKSGDYLQDSSVFLISCFRLRIFDTEIRNLINKTIATYYDFIKEFSVEEKDEFFEYRLALGLIRSFSTSTRFELDEFFSTEMYKRSLMIISDLFEHQSLPDSFILNKNYLFFEGTPK